MATSQNGGQVLQYGDPRLITTVIPGTADAKFVGGVNGTDLNTIFMYVGYRWHTEIEPINAGWNWGHNVRTIRGQSTGYSNHSAGEAIDINAPKHPLGTQTLTAKQLATLRSIASDLIGVIRFGAFYSGRKDEMHAERIGTYPQVSALAQRIRRGELPNVPDALRSNAGSAPAPAPKPQPAPAPQPAPLPSGEQPVDIGPYPGRLIRYRDNKGNVIRPAMSGNDIKLMQRRLNQHMGVLRALGTTADGEMGPDTDRVIRLYQWARHQSHGLDVDGVVGPATWKSLSQ